MLHLGKTSSHIPKYFSYKLDKWIFSIICLCSPSQKLTFVFVVYLEGILAKILLLYCLGGLKIKRHSLGCMFHYLKHLPFFSFSPMIQDKIAFRLNKTQGHGPYHNKGLSKLCQN